MTIVHEYENVTFVSTKGRRNERLITAGIVASATVTSGSDTLTSVVIAAGAAAVGQNITGSGIPDNTTILAVGSGTIQMSQNATATSTSVAVQSTSRTSLVGEYLFGRDAATSKINLCGGVAPIIVGAPTYAARYATFDQNNWFDTNLPDTQELTMLQVSAIPSGTQAYLMGNYNNSNGTDTTTFELTSGSLAAIACATDNTQQAFTSVTARTPRSEFTVKAVRTTGAADFVEKIDEYRGGVRVAGSTKTVTGKTRKVTTSANMAIGSARGSSGFAGTLQCVGAAIWSRHVPDTELLAVAAAISAKAAAFKQQAIAC